MFNDNLFLLVLQKMTLTKHQCVGIFIFAIVAILTLYQFGLKAAITNNYPVWNSLLITILILPYLSAFSFGLYKVSKNE